MDNTKITSASFLSSLSIIHDSINCCTQYLHQPVDDNNNNNNNNNNYDDDDFNSESTMWLFACALRAI